MPLSRSRRVSIEEFEALPNGTVFRASDVLSIMNDVERLNSDTVYRDSHGYVAVVMSAEEFDTHPIMTICEGMDGQYFVCLYQEGRVDYEDCYTHWFSPEQVMEYEDGFRLVKLS